ncbi:hypothetical protein [Aestuariirhabdus litorea]|uniref:Uncharacterized protein n=1 Tax=Aestuariirhabdus litorea TaxID=2528527 RepID=A0A3P3VM91_9GAMM|nr:hypothetical protein [Aestuariirhabdus litorea]RRJ83544.1 hypothetical protein D0544_16370 [Aestuariirhabdus litorea]RWW93550.1 hypothetical protein DZC74_16340 [Endozoicomonadaceae bacterium GTF-13]
MKPYAQPIFTLNARGNVLLEATRDYFGLSSEVMHHEIQRMHIEVQEVLQSKGVPYSALRSGLVPSIDRQEAGFIFDSEAIYSSLYGLEVAKLILPLFNRDSTNSVLCGDLIGDDQGFIYELLEESLVLARSFTFVHGTSLYCVYINNLSNAALNKFHEALSGESSYVGYIPGTFSSRTKTYLSNILVNAYLKNGTTVIMGHEDDRPNEENENLIGYPFEDYGYQVVSLQSLYSGLFLGYKIERPVFPGFEIDTEMSLNSVSEVILPLQGFSIELEEAKHDYLKTEKLGKLEKAGIADLGRVDLAELVRQKIDASYIYNMAYLQQHGVVKFNLMLEVPRKGGGYPTKLLAALEYQPGKKNLRLITLH